MLPSWINPAPIPYVKPAVDVVTADETADTSGSPVRSNEWLASRSKSASSRSGSSAPSSNYDSPTYSIPPTRFSELSNLKSTGWSGIESWSTSLAQGSLPAGPGNVYYSPVMLYDYKTMKGDFKNLSGDTEPTTASGKQSTSNPGGIYERNGGLYSVVMLNGSPAFQPVSFGGKKEGAFGAYQNLSDADKLRLGRVMLNRIGGENSGDGNAMKTETADAYKFLAANFDKLGDLQSSPAMIKAVQALSDNPEFQKEIPKDALEKMYRATDPNPPKATATGTAPSPPRTDEEPADKHLLKQPVN